MKFTLAFASTDQVQPTQTVLLTGGTGFLGSYLAQALLNEGYKLVILKRSTSDTWRIANMLSEVIIYNIDNEPLIKAFEDQHIDVVIHTACHFGRNGDPTHEIVKANLLLGIKLLDAAIFFKSRTFINTDTFYPKKLNSYSLSKKQFVEWLHMRFEKIQIINMKLQHVYGPLDSNHKFIPWLFCQFEKRVDEIKLTKGEQLRDFIYIEDVVSAYMIVLKKTQQNPAFNEFCVGTGKLRTVRSMVEMVKLAFLIKAPTLKTKLNFGALPYSDQEIMKTDVNNRNLLALGWQPEVELFKGIKKILEKN